MRLVDINESQLGNSDFVTNNTYNITEVTYTNIDNPDNWVTDIPALKAVTGSIDGDAVGVFFPFKGTTDEYIKVNFVYTYNSTGTATEDLVDYTVITPNSNTGRWTLITSYSWVSTATFTNDSSLYTSNNNGTVPKTTGYTTSALLQADPDYRWNEPMDVTSVNSIGQYLFGNAFNSTNLGSITTSNPTYVSINNGGSAKYAKVLDILYAVVNMIGRLTTFFQNITFKGSVALTTLSTGKLLYLSSSDNTITTSDLTYSEASELRTGYNTALHQHESSIIVQVVKFDDAIPVTGESPELLSTTSVPSTLAGWKLVSIDVHTFTATAGVITLEFKINTSSITITGDAIIDAGNKINTLNLSTAKGVVTGDELKCYSTSDAAARGLEVSYNFKKL